MTTAFDLLREAREQRHMTLADVAEATLINLEFLRAIDQGKIDILPEAYVRAFMREYAAVVGLDPAILMQTFDRERQVSPPPAPGEQEPAPPASPPPSSVDAEEKSAGSDTARRARTAVLVVTVAIAGVIVWNILGRETPVTPERPFHEVVRENERLLAPDSAAAPRAAALDSLPSSRPDSLTLTAHADDSVWVRLMVDEEAPREHFFRPGESLTWRAKRQFLFFTIGNPGAFRLALNGRGLALPGNPSVPLQRLAIGESGIIVPDAARKQRDSP
jgi:cytoskeletal protein RodZ